MGSTRTAPSAGLLRTSAVAIAALLVARVALAACGDGVLDVGEGCDHGAANGSDGCCSSACQVFDLDYDGLCDALDGCNFGPNSALVKETQLRFARLGTPPGDDRLRFSGVLTLPVVPAIDPGTNGFRVTVFTEPTGGPPEATVVLDLLIPGGRRWTSHGSGAWQYRDPAGRVGGVTRVSVKLLPPILPTTHLTNVAFLVQGHRGAYAITPAMVTSSLDNGQFHGSALFVEVSLAAGPGLITTQCGIQVYSTMNAPDVCDFDARGNTAVCHGPPPVGPCRVGDPNDLVFCDIVNAAHAEDAYFRAHGTYFTGPCSGLPGFQESPGVTCVASGSATAFTISDSHPNMRMSGGCTWTSPVSPTFQNLVCY